MEVVMMIQKNFLAPNCDLEFFIEIMWQQNKAPLHNKYLLLLLCSNFQKSKYFYKKLERKKKKKILDVKFFKLLLLQCSKELRQASNIIIYDHLNALLFSYTCYEQHLQDGKKTSILARKNQNKYTMFQNYY